MQENAEGYKWSEANHEKELDEEEEKIQGINKELDDIIKGWRQKADHLTN